MALASVVHVHNSKSHFSSLPAGIPLASILSTLSVPGWRDEEGMKGELE